MKNESEIRKTIRTTLIECRKEKGVTQTDVALYVGKTKTAVASWEQGISLPDAETLFKLAAYYNKPIAFMYGENLERKEG